MQEINVSHVKCSGGVSNLQNGLSEMDRLDPLAINITTGETTHTRTSWIWRALNTSCTSPSDRPVE